MPVDYHIHFATDCTDPYAKTDVQMALQEAADNIGVRYKHTFLPVGKFNWLELSYAAAHHYATRQTLRSKIREKKTQHIIIVNAAPPKSKDGKDAGKNNERHNFVLGKLKDGTVVAGTFNGLTLLRWHIKELYEFGASNNGSQFRSRDVLPEIAMLYAQGLLGSTPSSCKKVQDLALRLMKDDAQEAITEYDQPELLQAVEAMHNLTQKRDPQTFIPDFPNHSFVVQIDEPFKNVKLRLGKEDRVALREAFYGDKKAKSVTLRFSSASLADDATPSWSQQQVEAKILPRLFDGNDGDVVFALGSSSHIVNDHGNKEFMAQIITLQTRTDTKVEHPLPAIGSAVQLSFNY